MCAAARDNKKGTRGLAVPAVPDVIVELRIPYTIEYLGPQRSDNLSEVCSTFAIRMFDLVYASLYFSSK
jgi:hypothetical protein